MSRRNLIERLNALIKDGYVEDLDQGVKNRAHTYSVKKGEAKILSGMQISHTEIDTPVEANNGASPDSDIGMRNLHTSVVESAKPAYQEPPAMQNLPSQSAEIAHPGMQNLHLNRETQEETKRDKDTPNGVGETPPPAGPKTLVRDKFLELSHLQMPNLKRDSGFWWSQFGEILKLARGDPALACNWEGEAIGYMQTNHLTITGPQSILGMIRVLASGQSLQQSKGQTNGQHSKHTTQRNTDPDRIPSWDPFAERRAAAGDLP